MDSSSTSLPFVSRDESSPAAAPGDEAALSVAAGLAKEAALLFQAGKFADCLGILSRLLQKKDDPKILSMIETQHRPLLNGIELLEDARQNRCSLSTGCERIDILLQGGLREGHVTELVGPSSSGKTQVCLKAASHVAQNYSGTVMYFDAGNSFSAKRIADFLRQQPLDPSKSEGDRVLQQVMSSIMCHSVFDIFSLLDMLNQLMNNLRSQIGCQVRMLIIDSLSSLIAPVLGSAGPHGHALMINIGFLLKEIAHEHSLAILVTNHMVAGEAGSLKPALGESWKSIPHVRLLLSPHHATKDSCIWILKHPYLVGATCQGPCWDWRTTSTFPEEAPI